MEDDIFDGECKDGALNIVQEYWWKRCFVGTSLGFRWLEAFSQKSLNYIRK
jgi:hypothetical protein